MLTWVEVDLKTIRNNIKQIKKYIGPDVDVAAVIKSNAYGHGLIEVAKAADEAGAEFLCVDNVAEAKQLNNFSNSYKLKASVLILGGVESEDLPWVIRNNVRFGIYDLGFAKKVNTEAQRLGQKALTHIKIDTGMHRLGFDYDSAVESVKKINTNYKNIEIEGVWSHFADSGCAENKKYTEEQLKKFKNIILELEKNGIKVRYQHFSNSAGAIYYPEACFNLVRAGIIVYGVFPSKFLKRKFQKKLKLKPVMNFKTKIINLRTLLRGERIGYGLTFKLKKNSKIAVIAAGYKDGYGRDLSNKGEVIINNKKCPIVGRICMRMAMVDVSRVKDVKLGEEVILLGGNSRVRIEADEVGEKMETIPYEVLTRISESVPRIYK